MSTLPWDYTPPEEGQTPPTTLFPPGDRPCQYAGPKSLVLWAQARLRNLGLEHDAQVIAQQLQAIGFRISTASVQHQLDRQVVRTFSTPDPAPNPAPTAPLSLPSPPSRPKPVRPVHPDDAPEFAIASEWIDPKFPRTTDGRSVFARVWTNDYGQITLAYLAISKGGQNRVVDQGIVLTRQLRRRLQPRP